MNLLPLIMGENTTTSTEADFLALNVSLEQRRKAIYALLAVTLVWGATFIWMKQALDNLESEKLEFGKNGVVATLVAARFAIASVVMLTFFPRARIALADKKMWKDGLLLGILMFLSLKYKKIRESNNSSTQKGIDDKSNSNIYAVILMMLPMFVMGLIYNSVQGIMPKLFEERMPVILDGKIELVGTIVGFVYAVGAVSQILGGYLADKCNHKLLYLSIWVVQAPLLLLIANYGGFPVALFACILTMSGTSALPTENIMLSRYASNNHQGLTFGAKFLVTFCAAPLGVYLITHFRETTGEFTYVLFTLSIAAIIACISIIFLPNTGNKMM